MDAMINLSDKDSPGEENELVEIDPFTFYSSFNRDLVLEKRIAILKHLKAKLGLASPLPTEFGGIPTVNNQKAWFFPFAYERDPGDIPALWTLATKALSDRKAIRAEDFDRCLRIKQVGLAKLTQGLFWLAPDEFLATDRNNRKYLKNNHGIKEPRDSWAEYSKFLQTVRTTAGLDFTSLSKRAWRASQAKGGDSQEESTKPPTFYKVSHGAALFSDERLAEYKSKNLVVVHKGTKKRGGTRFADEMKIGDVVFIRNGNAGIHHLGRIISESQPCPTRSDGWLQRKYELIAESHKPGQEYDGPRRGWAPTFNSTCAPVRKNELTIFEEHLLKPFFNLSLSDVIAGKAKPTKPAALNRVKTENKIFYGPPGTGKTWHIQQQLNRFLDHQSIQTRQEFCQELTSGWSWWQTVAAALYDLKCGKVKQIEDHELVQARLAKSRNNNLRPTIWQCLQTHASPDDERVKYEQRQEPYIFRKGEESTWEVIQKAITHECPEVIDVVKRYRQGVPTTRLKKRYSFITFHQSYSYEEFVEGIRPVMGEDAEDEGAIRYQVTKGVFRDICDKAAADPESPYALFIDEINRGNISKIFGELITLVELDKRAGATNSIEVKLPYSHDRFSVPANLSIYGTMNTADRSLAHLDIALRRRFTFEEMMPKSELLDGLEIEGIDIRAMLEAINQRIELLYDREHTLGHSFFMRLKDNNSMEHLARVMEQEILPMLEEYFFEDWEKVRIVLGDHQKPPELAFIREKYDARQIDDLLGKDIDRDIAVYERNHDSLKSPKAYIGIYQSTEDI